MWESLKNVPLKKRVIVRTNLFEMILEITLFLSGTFCRESRNLYPRRGRGSLCAPSIIEGGLHLLSPQHLSIPDSQLELELRPYKGSSLSQNADFAPPPQSITAEEG